MVKKIFILVGIIGISLSIWIFSCQRSIQLPEYPDQKDIVGKIENYKKEHNRYPENLSLIGYGKYQVSGEHIDIGINYWLRDGNCTL